MKKRLSKSSVLIVGEFFPGNYSAFEAGALAKEHNLDLVEVNVQGELSVCKLLDFNKAKYEKSKRQKAVTKKKKRTREVTFSYQIDTNDMHHKMATALRLTKKGDDVRITVQMMGREANLYEDLGKAKLEEALVKLHELAKEIDVVIKATNILAKVIGKNKDIFTTVQRDTKDKA